MPRRPRYHKKRSRWPLWLALAVVVAAAVYIIGAWTRSTNLIDSQQELVNAGTAGWEYQQSMTADLDNDGSTETIFILARVLKDPLDPNEYQWDDGQPWQVYIQDGGDITRVYARFVQIGRLNVFVTDQEPPRLVIAEREGAGYSLYAVRYKGPGRTHTTKLAGFPVRDYR